MHPAAASDFTAPVDNASHVDTPSHAEPASTNSPAQAQPQPQSVLTSGLPNIDSSQKPASPKTFVLRSVPLPASSPPSSTTGRPSAFAGEATATQATAAAAGIASASSVHTSTVSGKTSGSAEIADGWDRPRGCLGEQKVPGGSLAHFSGAGGMEGIDLSALGRAMAHQKDVQLYGHATAPGLRGRLKMPSGPGADGQTVEHALGFQLQLMPNSQTVERPNGQTVLVGISKWENGTKVSHVVNPLLSQLFDLSGATPEQQQRLSHTLANAAPPSWKGRLQALPSPAYLAQHGLALGHLALHEAPPMGPSDEHLKVMLRRLVTNGKIDIPKTEIDQTGRDRHIELLTMHAQENGGMVKLDRVGFVQLPPNLTWHATNSAARTGNLSARDGHVGLQGELDAARKIGDMPPKE